MTYSAESHSILCLAVSRYGWCLAGNVIPDNTVLGRPFMFSQSCFQVSASLPSISGLAVSTFDVVHRSLSVVRLVFVLDVGQYVS